MKIVIASGKGGVGKSMFASALAMLFSRSKRVVAVDCDVDAPNLHLWLGERENSAFAKAAADTWDKVEKISTNEKPVIDQKKCNLCGQCVDICVFSFLKIEKNKTNHYSLITNHYFCEGCGACEIVCPQKTIKMKPIQNAEIKI